MNIRDKVRQLEPEIVAATIGKAMSIEKGITFHWNEEQWEVKEICLNKEGKPTGHYLCSPSNPWSENEPCYWTQSEIIISDNQ
jgi:hypothetical protein